MEVKYSKAALKFLAKSDKATVNRIRIGIEGLKINPPKGDIKLMQGFDDGRQRLRIGKYRIIFKRLLDGTYEIIYIIYGYRFSWRYLYMKGVAVYEYENS